LNSYIDTSILVPYYFPERLSNKTEQTLRSIKQPILSSLVEVEIFSAIAKKMRLKEISRKDALGIFTLFRSHVETGNFIKLPAQAIHFNQARDFIRDLSTPLRTLDALHLAISTVEDLCLITSDKALAKSAKQLGCNYKLIS